MSFIVRPYELKDLFRIAEIEKSCFEHPWSYDSFCMEYADKSKHYFVAENEDGTIIGYGGFMHVEDEAHIMNVAVAEPFRQEGAGAAIMSKMLEKARSLGIKAVTLEVDNANIAAIALYEKSGFECAGLRPHYYGWDRPARIYWYYFDKNRA